MVFSTFTQNDLHLTMWTHDPAALNHLLDGRARVQLRPSFHVLSVNGTLFSLATPDQRTPCLQDDDYLPATREKPPWSAPHGVRRGTTDLSLLSLGRLTAGCGSGGPHRRCAR